MPTIEMSTLTRYFGAATPAIRIIIGSADSEMRYGTTLVTTARLTNALNCSLRFGDIVESAITDWTMPITTIPATGAPIELAFENRAGNMSSSAAAFAVWASVNCHPSSEPMHAITASTMTM